MVPVINEEEPWFRSIPSHGSRVFNDRTAEEAHYMGLNRIVYLDTSKFAINTCLQARRHLMLVSLFVLRTGMYILHTEKRQETYMLTTVRVAAEFQLSSS